MSEREKKERKKNTNKWKEGRKGKNEDQPKTIVHGESNQIMVGCVAKSRQWGPTQAPHVTEIFPPVEKFLTAE